MPKLVVNNKTSSNQPNPRRKYLYKLGFESPQSASTPNLPVRPQSFSYQEQLNDADMGPRYQIPVPSLRYEYNNQHSPNSVMDFHQTISMKPKSSVSFLNSVDVRIIPNKDQYSQRIRKYLWNTPKELADNKERNAIEFQAENWDWQQAIDEDQFFTCSTTGDKIHPAHVHWLDYVMAARQQQQGHQQHSFLQQSSQRNGQYRL